MKRLIINNEYPNGLIEDINDKSENNLPILPYEQRVVNRIREVYSVDDELALLRQRDTKLEEFAEYNAFVEKIKAEEKGTVI